MGSFVLLISAAVLFLKIKESRDVIPPCDLLPKSASPDNITANVPVVKIKSLRQFFAKIKSMENVLLLLLSIFFLYVGFNSVSSFFTLFAQNHLGVTAAVATGKFAFLAGLMVLFALPAGLIGAKIGKKKAILIGTVVMILVFGSINFTNDINVIGYLFIPAGAAWSLIMINAYPFVVSMTTPQNVGSYTGFYYLASSLAAISSPPFIGMLIDKFEYGILFKYSVAGFILALIFILFVKTPKEETQCSLSTDTLG
jgi:MFS family permease